jgi:hypothetical protein
VQHHAVAIGQLDLVDHRGGGGDQIEVELAAQPLLDDLEMQEPEEAAAEAEAERGRGFHLEREARVVEAQLAHGGAQLVESHWHRRERGRRTPPAAPDGSRAVGVEVGFLSSVMVSPTLVSATSLIEAVKTPISPGPSSLDFDQLGGEDADPVELIDGA